MADESTIQLADAMVAAINAVDDWPVQFTAAREWEYRFEVNDWVVRLILCPQEPDVSESAKDLHVTMTLQAKVKEPSKTLVDPLWNLYFAVRDLLDETALTVNGLVVVWQPSGTPTLDRDILRDNKVFMLSGDMHRQLPIILTDVTR